MWNYSFLFPSILVLATLLAFYFARPRLPIRINRLFVSMLLMELFIIAFDIVSSLADENYAMFSSASLYVLNTLFFVLYLSRLYLFFLFETEILHLRDRKLLLILLSIPFVVCEVIAVSSFVTGAVFAIENGAYKSGPFYGILYYEYLFYIFVSLALLLGSYRRLKAYQMLGNLSYLMMLLAGTLARRLFPRLLVMNTFSLVALLIIYLTFENPDLYLNDRGQTFNMRALRALLGELVRHRDYHILAFAVKNYTHERGIYGGAQMDEGITLISRFLRHSFPECTPFYLRSGRFVLTGSASVDWERIREQLEDRFRKPWMDDFSSIYMPIGFAEISPQNGLDSAERILSNLTIALEMVGQADATAPHSMVMDAESILKLDEQVDILRTLERSIKDGNVEVFLQPVFDSTARRMVAAEALARIRDQEGNIIPPSLFIPIAEKNGYINRLGEIVFEKTCAFILNHDMDSLGLSWINVNLSPIQCMQPDIARQLNGILKRYGISAERIHLEITEQSIIDFTLLEKQIIELREHGFQFVLDDYGSGYSNLIRVRQYPFINIKLDMEVVWDYFHNRDHLLPTVVDGFRKSGFSVTAEGIETVEMAEALTAIGCDFLQGFLFDRPLPVDEFVKKYSGSLSGPF